MFYNGSIGKKPTTSRQSKITWGKSKNPKLPVTDSRTVDLTVETSRSRKENTPPGWLTQSHTAFSDKPLIDLTEGEEKNGAESELEIVNAPFLSQNIIMNRQLQKPDRTSNNASLGLASNATARTHSIVPSGVVAGTKKRELPWETAAAALKKQNIVPRIQRSSQTKPWNSSQASQMINGSVRGNASVQREPLTGNAMNRSLSESLSADIYDAVNYQPGNLKLAKKASRSNTSTEYGEGTDYKFYASHDGSVVQLNDEQIAIYKLALSGESIFFTGAAGTGKSVLLRSIIKGMQMKHGFGPEVAITATTGMAALNIGGRTLHSWSGVGYGNKPVDQIVAHQSRECKERWSKVRVLIVDEVSMLDGNLLDLLDSIARQKRGQLPFGGIQIILTGDFYQLPPVVKNNQKLAFAFQAKCWKETIHSCFELKTVHRQKGDNELIEMLTAMRKNELTNDINKKFFQLSRQLYFEDGNEATRLFSLRREVGAANQRRLDQLSGRVFEYVAQDGGAAPPYVQKSLLDSFREEEVLKLKIGTQVMLVENKNEFLVNGSRGKIESFASETAWSKIDLRRTQYEDYLELYNAVLNGLDKQDPSIQEKLSKLPSKTRQELYTFAAGKVSDSPAKGPEELIPIVRFLRPGGTSTLEPMPRHEYKIMRVDGRGKEIDPPEAFRVQIPLVLSYAMSIHKAQGQTIDRLIVDLNTIFAAGQAYVAVSRATKRDSLQILNYSPSKVFVNKDVIQFYRELR
jgi:ATP-dependent DNA helicase PIF1